MTDITVKENRNTERKKEGAAKGLFLVSAVFSVAAVFAIVFYILLASFPAFREIGVFHFLFGKTWAPLKEYLAVSDRFGILPMIVGSLSVTFGAVLLGGTLGIFSAIFLSYFCPKKLKGVFSEIINLLSGIPSIIYGFFGIVVLVPLLIRISPNGNGKGILASSLILGIMILPTVAGIAKNAIEAVPKSYFEGALALGSTKEQAVFKVILPAARSGIVSGLILGVGRAIGETMAVMMVAGNTAAFPHGLFDNLRTLTTNVVMEMAYSEGLHRQALIATAFVLLVFVLILNFLLGLIKTEKKPSGKEPKARRLHPGNTAASVEAKPDSGANAITPARKESLTEAATPHQSVVFKKTGGVQAALKYASAAISVLVSLSLALLVCFILIKGVPHITIDFLFGASGNEKMTLAPAFVSTGILILIALVIALPIGIGAAIYLVEYAKKGSKLVRVIRLFTDTLAGIPSIVFGLFGMIFFGGVLHLGYSLLSGGLTLVLIILPTIVRSTEESLLAVPDSLREGSLALGASKVGTIFRVVLPSAISGIMTAIILSVGRIVGESAALIYTAGAVPYMPTGITEQGSSFAVMMWMFAGEGLYLDQAYATASVLLVFVAVLNLLARLTEKKLKKGKTV